MGEPFSTVAAAIALVGTVVKASKSTKAFIDSIRGAPRSVNALSGNVGSLTDVLETLETLLRGLDSRRFPEQARLARILHAPLVNCKTALQDIEKELAPFVKQDNNAKTSKWKAFRFAYREKDVLALQRILESSQHSLDSAVTVVNL